MPSSTSNRASTMPIPPPSSSEPVGAACAIPPPGERSSEFPPSVGIKVSQKPPTHKEISQVANLPVLDEDRNERTFLSLYDDDRYDTVLVLFVRHFFCGQCQEFLRTLATTLPPSALPARTTITIIGHGAPELIPFYRAATSSPYPIHADPSKKLYAALGMGRTLALGPERLDYTDKSLMGMIWSSFVQNVGQGRKALRGGDYWQVGGELVFRRQGVAAAATAGSEAGDNKQEQAEQKEPGSKQWDVVFCHRMRSTRDHTPLPELGRALGVGAAEEVTGSRGSESSEDDVLRQKREGHSRPAVKKRWTMTDGVSGVRRSLSVRRGAWGRSRSGSRSGSRVRTEGGRVAAAH